MFFKSHFLDALQLLGPKAFYKHCILEIFKPKHSETKQVREMKWMGRGLVRSKACLIQWAELWSNWPHRNVDPVLPAHLIFIPENLEIWLLWIPIFSTGHLIQVSEQSFAEFWHSLAPSIGQSIRQWPSFLHLWNGKLYHLHVTVWICPVHRMDSQ